MDVNQESLKLHEELRGKIEVVARRHIETRYDLSLLYTPGVAEPCREIAKDYEKSFTLTRRSNLVAVITDGSAVLGLGDIGPAAGMPVMEGKCALFKEFGGVDAFPLCVDTKDVDKLVETIALISKSFGGSNLEDIDPADAILELVWAQTCYNAALQVGTNVIPQSLMDYMK